MMIVIEYSARPGHQVDKLWVEEKDWHCVLNEFEMSVDGLEPGESLSFEVKVHDLSEKEWQEIQEEFIEIE